MINRTKVNQYTEMFLKYRRGLAWLKKQVDDFNKKKSDMDPEKLKKAVAWVKKQHDEFSTIICDPLDEYWMDELNQDERNAWMFENEKLVDG